MIELDKFLRCEPNHLKEHRNYANFKYEYIDKSYPTEEAAHAMFHQQSAKQNKI